MGIREDVDKLYSSLDPESQRAFNRQLRKLVHQYQPNKYKGVRNAQTAFNATREAYNKYVNDMVRNKAAKYKLDPDRAYGLLHRRGLVPRLETRTLHDFASNEHLKEVTKHLKHQMTKTFQGAHFTQAKQNFLNALGLDTSTGEGRMLEDEIMNMSQEEWEELNMEEPDLINEAWEHYNTGTTVNFPLYQWMQQKKDLTNLLAKKAKDMAKKKAKGEEHPKKGKMEEEHKKKARGEDEEPKKKKSPEEEQKKKAKEEPKKKVEEKREPKEKKKYGGDRKYESVKEAKANYETRQQYPESVAQKTRETKAAEELRAKQQEAVEKLKKRYQDLKVNRTKIPGLKGAHYEERKWKTSPVTTKNVAKELHKRFSAMGRMKNANGRYGLTDKSYNKIKSMMGSDKTLDLSKIKLDKLTKNEQQWAKHMVFEKIKFKVGKIESGKEFEAFMNKAADFLEPTDRTKKLVKKTVKGTQVDMNLYHKLTPKGQFLAQKEYHKNIVKAVNKPGADALFKQYKKEMAHTFSKETMKVVDDLFGTRTHITRDEFLRLTPIQQEYAIAQARARIKAQGQAFLKSDKYMTQMAYRLMKGEQAVTKAVEVGKKAVDTGKTVVKGTGIVAGIAHGISHYPGFSFGRDIINMAFASAPRTKEFINTALDKGIVTAFSDLKRDADATFTSWGQAFVKWDQRQRDRIAELSITETGEKSFYKGSGLYIQESLDKIAKGLGMAGPMILEGEVEANKTLLKNFAKLPSVITGKDTLYNTTSNLYHKIVDPPSEILHNALAESNFKDVGESLGKHGKYLKENAGKMSEGLWAGIKQAGKEIWKAVKDDVKWFKKNTIPGLKKWAGAPMHTEIPTEQKADKWLPPEYRRQGIGYWLEQEKKNK